MKLYGKYIEKKDNNDDYTDIDLNDLEFKPEKGAETELQTLKQLSDEQTDKNVKAFEEPIPRSHLCQANCITRCNSFKTISGKFKGFCSKQCEDKYLDAMW